jgi:carbon-monoxide dehydrogenase medium subunit
LHRFDYYTPRTVAETIDLLKTKGEGGKILAGGTDLLPQMKERGRHPKYIVSLKNVKEIQQLSFQPAQGLKVGAGTRFRVLQQNASVREQYPIIIDTAKMIGSLQTQALATIGGNVCNAAPSADAVPAFIVLDAEAVVHGAKGERTLALKDLFRGPGQTALASDEVLTELRLAAPLPRSAGVYIRHVPRKELDIAIAGAGVYIQLDEAKQRITHARVCLASVAPVPMRATQTEAALVGQAVTEELFQHAGDVAAGEAQPISDQRGSAAFRKALVKALTARCLDRAVNSIRG